MTYRELKAIFRAQEERYGTFDAEDAFKIALRRSYGEEKENE